MTNPTHIATRPNARPPMAIDALKIQLAKEYQQQVTNYFDGDKDKALKFMSAVIYSVQKTPKLLECDRTSLLQSFMSCAEFQLFPSNVSGEAYILPYKGKAQFQLGYQGLVTLLWRAGISIKSQLVYEKDEFIYEEGLNSKLVHRPNVFTKDRGKLLGVYAVATFANGQQQFHVMSEDDVLTFKEFSQAKASEFSPWNSKQDPEKWMYRKTCIKQLSKTLPKNETIKKAIAKDNEESVINRSPVDAAGPATPKALHVPQDEPTYEEVGEGADLSDVNFDDIK